MAKKKPPIKTFSIQGFDVQAYKQTEAYVQAIDALYNKAINDFAQLATTTKIDPAKQFSFSDYPGANAAAQRIVNTLASKMQSVIANGSRNQWLYACKKNDEFLSHIMSTSRVPKKVLDKMQDRNLKALDSFQNRKVNGMDLSKRVWNYAGQMKDNMEMGIDVGIGKGKSAANLARELRQNMNDPDNLFRRVRDKNGNLQLSKNAKAFHPGQGVYRSSVKNAQRLTRSEINMAYRQSDILRWQQLDFVVGFEVKVSERHKEWLKEWKKHNPGKTEICDQLAGKYPKAFFFKGWHPQCMCHVIPIMMDRDEFNTDELNELKAAFKGEEYNKFTSRNTVTDVPDGFKQWTNANKEASGRWASQPYFIKDNFKGGTIQGGLSLVKPTISEPVIQRVEQQVQQNVPGLFDKNSTYLKGKQIEFKNEFFNLVDKSKPVAVKISSRGKSSYYDPNKKLVNIVDDDRNAASDWHRESVVYHEYGHAIDDQRGIKVSMEMKDFMGSVRSTMNKQVSYKKYVPEYSNVDGKFKVTYKSVQLTTSRISAINAKLSALHNKISKMSPEVFKRIGITRDDVIEQIGSTMDAIMALNPTYGYGHTKAYFNRAGMKETEFLSHCFENAYAGNSVFKKYLPDVYEEMIRFVKGLKPIQ